MNVQPLDPDHARAVAEAMALDDAVRAVDEPSDPPPALPSYTAYLRHGWDGEPDEEWLLRVDDEVVGAYAVNTPHRDNHHVAHVGVRVHPDHRHRGYGTWLLDQALDRVRSAGRRVVVGHSLDQPGPVAWATANGFGEATVEDQRRQDFEAVDWDTIEKLNSEARDAARGYTLLRVVGAVPGDLVDEVAVMTAAINDAPTGDLQIEDEVFDARRIRGFEHAQAEGQRRVYRLIARRDSDGALAGHTVVGVALDQPGWAWQYDTSVLRQHRGHRLGLWLKSEMMRWLHEAEPTVCWVDTWNAESNAHMIAVNEVIGYQIVARHVGWQRSLD